MGTWLYVVVILLVLSMIWKVVKGFFRILLMGFGVLLIVAVVAGGDFMGITVEREKVESIKAIATEFASKASDSVRVEGMDVKVRTGSDTGDWLSLKDIVKAVQGEDGMVKVVVADGKEYIISDVDALGIVKRLYNLVRENSK